MKLLTAMLDLLGASANATARLVATIVLWLVAGLMVTTGYIVFSIYFGLISPRFFVGALAVVTLMLSSWLSKKGFGAAKVFMAVSLMTMLGVAWPGLAHLMGSTKHVTNSWLQERGDLIVTPKVVPCQKPFFIGEDSHSRYWHVAGSPECLDRAGKHPETDQRLVPVMPDDVVDILKAQATLPPPPPTSIPLVEHAGKMIRETPEPIPTIAPTPIPAPIAQQSCTTTRDIWVTFKKPVELDRYRENVKVQLNEALLESGSVVAPLGAEVKLNIGAANPDNQTAQVEIVSIKGTSLRGRTEPVSAKVVQVPVPHMSPWGGPSPFIEGYRLHYQLSDIERLPLIEHACASVASR